ncbi:OmpA family protein [Streptomyces albipurpureus]|uniref:OmpA family protein n=1 Tax=Streptomyces albipurpureus TaxID=2897419 RepID=A0ABT0UPJ1_9ACTN|nr:OmpA family protein [Streptomyces sp. CWNU-1]MCM2389171.1 OmpA family protein [Streptomyces sp. CWNU-1]
MRRTSRPPLAVSLVVVLMLTGFQLSAASDASAKDDPSVPPGTEPTAAAPKVDGNNPGLRMREGATLAGARVLDIVSIVESEGGEERREERPSSLKFALQAEVLFGKDSAKLSPQANSRISVIVAEIRKHQAKRLRVFGFTDDLGTREHGQVLSKKRADAVHGVLSQQLNDGGITYEVRGYSEDYPIADNDSEEGRRKNRRVEVSFPTGGAG